VAYYGPGPAPPGPAVGGPWQTRVLPRPPRRSRHGLAFGLGTLLVAVVVAIVVIASILTTGEDRLSEIWSVPKPDKVGDATTVMAYPTTDGKTFVRVDLYGAVGYDLATGRTKWRVQVPARSAVCASTHGALGGVGAFVYGGKGGCTTVVAFDTRTGARLWSSAPVVQDSSDPPNSAALAAAGGRIYVSNTERIVGYDARTGEKGTGPAAPVTAKPSAAGCGFDGVAATARRLVTIEACGESHRSLVGMDPRTLRTAFRTPLRLEHDQEVHVVNVAPLVLHATNALDNGELRFFDDAGRQTRVFSSRQRRGTLVLESASGGGYHDDNVSFPVRVVGDTLVADVDAGDDFESEHKVAGIDVRAGRWAWTSPLDTTNDVHVATGDDPRKVTLFAEGGYSSGVLGRKERPHLLDVDPASGEVTKGDSLDVGDDTDFYSASIFAVGSEVLIVRVTTAYDAPIVTAYGRN
jgi:hypothetical protein